MENYEFWATLAAIITAALVLWRVQSEATKDIREAMRDMQQETKEEIRDLRNQVINLGQRVSAIEGKLGRPREEGFGEPKG